MKKIRIPVASEGTPFILFAAFATLILALVSMKIPALAALAGTAFVLYFFRDPSRIVPDDDSALVSPADGRIIVLDSKYRDDRYLMAEVQKISIFMNVFDVHVNRTPCSGMVKEIVYKAGRFYSADSIRAGLENETCALILDVGENRRIACVQMAGLIARRIVCWAEKGDSLARGSRFGMIRFGSRVDLYLPAELKIEVKNGQRVKAGETILGRFTE